MSLEELRNFRVTPSKVPLMLEVAGWPQEAIENLTEAEIEWYATEANRIIIAHFASSSPTEGDMDNG